MSKEVYSIENQEKFNIAMAVGFIAGRRFARFCKLVEGWTYDVEYANLALAVYNEVKGKECDENMLRTATFNHFTAEGILKGLPNAEEDEDYQDFWYGTECGDYFGMPTPVSLKKADEAMRAFMDQMKYGYVHEVIEANDLAYFIVTKFGMFENLIVESYGGDSTYSLAKIDEEDDTYSLLGFDAPTKDDNVWRFWVECGDSDGHAETYAAELLACDEEHIKSLYKKYRERECKA